MADVELLLDPVSSKYEYNSRDLQGVTTVVPVLFRFFLTPFFFWKLRNDHFSRHPFFEISEIAL